MMQVDTREKPHAIVKILAEFNRQNIIYFHKKLNVGDYCNTDFPLKIIDRKQSLLELCQNLGQEKARFYRECERARIAGIRLIILCEHGGIKQLSDVANWQNPRIKDSPRALTGRELMERLYRLKMAYGIDVLFCDKKDTGKKIIELLRGDILCT